MKMTKNAFREEGMLNTPWKYLGNFEDKMAIKKPKKKNPPKYLLINS